MNDDKRLSQMEAELKERFREAFDDYLKENGEEIPDPDLSFLNKPREKKRHSHIYRFATVAACVALIFVTSSSMAVWMNSEAAHAMKFNLEKTFSASFSLKINPYFFAVRRSSSAEREFLSDSILSRYFSMRQTVSKYLSISYSVLLSACR